MLMSTDNELVTRYVIYLVHDCLDLDKFRFDYLNVNDFIFQDYLDLAT